MAKSSPRKVLPWFGSNTRLAPVVGDLLGPLRWCGVPFCGGCSEMKHIFAKRGVANDLHGLAINLYQVIASPVLLDQLVLMLLGRMYHSTTLELSQIRCKVHVQGHWGTTGSVEMAADYFVVAWMGRKGQAGSKGEFNGKLAVRWTSEGGDPVMEYNNAVDALAFWRDTFRNWAFLCTDAFDFIRKVKDQEGHGLYIDAPWPEFGNSYIHTFSELDHERLARMLGGFNNTRVLIRFGDHPLIRRLYPESIWRWRIFKSKNQSHNTISDVLISNWDTNLDGFCN